MKYLKLLLGLLFNFIIIHLFIGVIWLNSTYGHTTGEEKIFHLLVPLDGVNSDYFISYMFLAIVPTLILAVILMLILRKNKYKKIILSIIAMSSLIFSFYELDVWKYLYNNINKSNFIEENYVDPDSVNISFNEKKNLIYIMLESMENTYSSKENGGYMKDNLVPNLTKLSKENISFSNTDKMGGALYLEGSNFTVASMLSQVSGMPLKINISNINKYDFEKFYIGTTIGDVLYNNGYDNYIIMGSNSKYGARKYLYENHHYKISDVNTAIENNKMKKEDIVWWGYSDKDLFRYAKEELLEISKNNKPFNYSILTADTHFEDGYMEDNCEKKFGDQYSNVIYCSDSMINEFIYWIKKQSFYDNTVIVLVGDHISMDTNYFKNVSKKYDRTTYNTFINTGFNKDDILTKRLFSQYDLFPTTISSIGGVIDGNRLGLGTNLFSNEQTIIEKYGYKYTRKELNKKSDFYNTLIGQK